jgi:hypothetical protein
VTVCAASPKKRYLQLCWRRSEVFCHRGSISPTLETSQSMEEMEEPLALALTTWIKSPAMSDASARIRNLQWFLPYRFQ